MERIYSISTSIESKIPFIAINEMPRSKVSMFNSFAYRERDISTMSILQRHQIV